MNARNNHTGGIQTTMAQPKASFESYRDFYYRIVQYDSVDLQEASKPATLMSSG
ncbi:MAG: hypothetical protein HWE27_08745 [Gammaproteobacteria bacterium]|nr:hypothetical protein [Gammaproteobacteria bacterium]